MTSRHKSMRHKSLQLMEHEHDLLTKLYLQRKIPIEQFEQRTTELDNLVEEWNSSTGRSDSSGEVLHYMRTKRKKGRWVRFDGAHLPQPAAPDFSADEIEALVAIYSEDIAAMGIGSDAIGYEDELRAKLVTEFARRTGRVMAAGDLVCKLTSLRKMGLLPKAADVPQVKPEDVGFEDINQAQA